MLENRFCRVYLSHLLLNALNMMRLPNYGITAVYIVCLCSPRTDAVCIQLVSCFCSKVTFFICNAL